MKTSCRVQLGHKSHLTYPRPPGAPGNCLKAPVCHPENVFPHSPSRRQLPAELTAIPVPEPSFNKPEYPDSGRKRQNFGNKRAQRPLGISAGPFRKAVSGVTGKTVIGVVRRAK